MMFRGMTLGLASVLSLVAPSNASGNAAITVLGNSNAHDCFLSASTRSTSVASLENCRKALDSGELSNKEHAATLVNMGIILNALSRVDEAHKAFAKALDRSPQLPEAVLSRGNSYFLQRDYDRAIADYELSLQYGVKDPAAAHFNHGLAHHKKKNFKQAAQSYQRAIEIKPDFRRAQARLDQIQKLGLSQQSAPRPKPSTY